MRFHKLEKFFKQFSAHRILLENFTLAKETITTPVEIGDPISVVPGRLYQVVYAVEYDGVDDGTGLTPKINVRFDGVEFVSMGQGENPGPMPYFYGYTIEDGIKDVGSDIIYICGGTQLQIALGIEDANGAQSDNDLLCDRFAISLVS